MPKNSNKSLIERREKLLKRWDDIFEIPLIILGFLWLVFLIIEFSSGLTPFLEVSTYAIWVIFILDFLIRYLIAPHKIQFIKSQWLTVIALIVPAFRVLRGFQLMRLGKSIQLIRVGSTIQRGMQMAAILFGRHGFSYVIVLTLIIVFVSAAGIYALETKFTNYGDALWWTAMMITTMGTDFWPETAEGRILCLALAIYAFAIFGYITANVASLLIEKDKAIKNDDQKIIASVEELKSEIKSLKKEKL